MGEQPHEAENDVGERRQQADLDKGRHPHRPVQDAPAWDHWTDLTLSGLHNGLRPVLDYQRSLRQWLFPAALLAIPYLILGLIWALTHTERLARLGGLDLVVSFLGSVALWPVALVFTVCT